MGLLKLKNSKKGSEFYKTLVNSLLDLQKMLDLQKESFNLDKSLILIGDTLEKNNVSVLVTIFSDKRKSLFIRYLNDSDNKKRLRKSFDYYFLNSRITVDKKNLFSKAYSQKEVRFIGNRQKDIYKTYEKSKKFLLNYSINSIVCPILIKGQVIGYFEFFSKKLTKEHLEIFKIFIEKLVRSISSALLFKEVMVSEEKYKDIFDNAKEGFYILDGRKKKFIDVNKAIQKITGYTRDELLQMSYLTVFSPAERDRIDSYVKKRLENKNSVDAPKNYETEFISKQGKKKNIELNVSRYINNDEWFVVVNDISQRKKTEKKLKEANENQAKLNNLLQISIEEIDLKEKIRKMLDSLLGISWANKKLSGALWILPEKNGKDLTLVSSKNFPKNLLKTCSVESLGKSDLGEVIFNNKIEFFESKNKKTDLKENDYVKINSCYIPLMHEETVLGALQFLFKEKIEIGTNEMEFFKTVSNIIASAIDREKGRRELEQSEEKYRDLVDNAGDMFVMLDLNINIIFANQSFYSNFPKEKIEKNFNFLNIIDEEDLKIFKEKFEDFFKNRGNQRIEFKAKNTNKLRYASANFTNIIKKGEVVAVQAIIRDISEARLAQQRLYETKKHYLSVVDTIQDGIFVVDKNLKIISYNKYFAEKIGFSVKEIKNKKCYKILANYENNLFHDELKKKSNMSNSIKSVFIKEMFFTTERKVFFKKRFFCYKIDVSPTKNSKGEVYQAVVTISNITKNKEAEEEIRRLDEFKNRVLNNVPVSIAMLDKKGRISSLNEHAKKMMGEEPIGSKLISTKEISGNKKLFSLYDNLIKKGKSFKYDNLSYISDKDEKVNYLNLIASPLFDADGGVEGAISIAVDNTEPMTYRERIESLNLNLENKVKLRTTELDAANKKLNQALDLKLKFISDASHELRTPLTIMKGNLDLLFLSKDNINENLLEVYRDMEDEIERMSRIISDLTMLTNADSEMEKLLNEKVDMTRLVEAAVKSLSIMAREKNISLKFGPVFKSFFIEGDEAKLDKVVLNLIRNAIKYTDENGWIKIYLNKKDEKVILKIKDNGIGIPKKDLPNIFERFYRVDKARSRVEGGTGLGLSICKWIIEAHRGAISVNSEEGVGSEFLVELPTKR